MTEVPIQIGNQFLVSACQVAETLTYEMIIGLNILTRNKCLIDCTDFKLSFNGEVLPLVENPEDDKGLNNNELRNGAFKIFG